MEGYGAHLAYSLKTTPDGGAEIDPEELAGLAIDCLDETHRQVQSAGFRIAGVAFSAFWHSFCGVGGDGRATLPILHLLDTRSAAETTRVPLTHARTGCMPHASYWPAKLLWLASHRSAEFQATCRWLSFSEYLFEKLFGTIAGIHLDDFRIRVSGISWKTTMTLKHWPRFPSDRE